MRGKALAAELIGTFALVYVGVMAIGTNLIQGAEIGRVGIALAHGFTIAVFASATMAISGGHLNPAVSFGLWIGRRITFKRMIGYWLAQLIGAVLASFLAIASIPKYVLINAGFDTITFGVPVLHEGLVPDAGGLPFIGILIEIVLTFFLMYVILGTAVDWRAAKMGGLYIGLAVTLDILAGGPLTGAAMNPARWFGPALAVNYEGVPGMFSAWAVYTIGPLVGAALAGVLYGRIPEEQTPVAPIAEAHAGVVPK